MPFICSTWAVPPRRKRYERYDNREWLPGVNVLEGTPLEHLEHLYCAHLTCQRRGCDHTQCGTRACGQRIGVAEYHSTGKMVAVWLVPGLHKVPSTPGEPERWAWSKRAARSPRHTQRSAQGIAVYGDIVGGGSWQILGRHRYIFNPSSPLPHREMPEPDHHRMYLRRNRDDRGFWSSHMRVVVARLPLRITCLCSRETWLEATVSVSNN
jgi:hypothetical protein